MPNLRLLDGFRLNIYGSEQIFPMRIQRFIAHVALRGRPSRLSVAGQLWPDVTDERAQANLRTSLYRLQSSCPGVIHTAGGALWLDDEIRVDVRDLTHWALRVLAGEVAASELEVPEGVYTAELLPGWYEEWVSLEREQLRQLRLHALEARCEQLIEAGSFGMALYAAHSAVRVDPLRESARRAAIRVHLAEGNLIEAIREYQSYRELLSAEMGIEPTPQMQALVEGMSEVGRHIR